METCRADDCDRTVEIKKSGLCRRHNMRLHRHGDPNAWKKPTRPVCSLPDCEDRAAARGLCDTHYRRQKRYGTTDAPVRPTVCAVAGCDGAVASYALCDKHYRRSRKGQDADRFCRYCGGKLDVNAHVLRVYCSDFCKERDHCIRRREGHRARWLRQYGLTVDEFEALLLAQEGRCAICRTDKVPRRGNWHVDHCHESGRIRGILCHGCNVALGHFKDNADLLRRAAEYLQPER